MDLRKKDKAKERNPDIVRSARFLETEDGWFFRTREDIMLGPYLDKFDAELSASLLVARLAQLDDGKDPAAIIQSFENDPSNATVRNANLHKPVDLKAIRRKYQSGGLANKAHRAWKKISQLKTLPKKLKFKT